MIDRQQARERSALRYPSAHGTRPAPSPGAAPDGQTFDDLYQDQRSALEGYLVACGASQDDARDAVQTAFVRLLVASRPIREPVFWLRRVALNEYRGATPRFRSRRRRVVEMPTSPDALPQHGVAPSAADAVDVAEQRRAVLDAIAALPDKQRLVMASHYDGLPTAAIARLLDMRPAAVRQNLRRGRRALKRSLAPSPGGPHDPDA